MAVADFNPMFVTAGRSLLAAAAATRLWARPMPPASRDWLRLFPFSQCAIVGFPLLMTIAVQYAPASLGAAVLAMLPLLTARASVVLAGERPSLGIWSCGLAGSGAVFVYAVLAGAGSSDMHRADALLACAALSAATIYALERDGPPRRRLGGHAWALLRAAPVMLLLLLVLAGPINWAASPRAWIGFISVAVFRFGRFLGFLA
jgi:drug/metabolite transporter (DMT)-like permease